MQRTLRKSPYSPLIKKGLSSAWIASHKTGNHLENATIGIARWATTDHTGLGLALMRMPRLGVLDTIKYVIFRLIIAILASLLTGLLFFLIIAFGIPYLITGSLH